MSYDPVVDITRCVVCAPAPTYVDDTAGLVVGPVQALRMVLFLALACKLAGLKVQVRTCVSLEVFGITARALYVLSYFPVDIYAHDASVHRVRGFWAPLLVRILDHTCPGWCDQYQLHELPCECGLKTAIVPAQHVDGWRLVFCDTLIGKDGVRPEWPYLGAIVAGCLSGPGARKNRQMVQQGIWKRPESRLDARVDMIAAPREQGNPS